MLLLLSGMGCALNPVSHQLQLTTLSAPDEARIGQQALAELRRTRRFVADSRVTGLVRDVGEQLARLAPGAPYPYEFHVLDADEANAFALPGGVVLVTRGLLTVCNNVDELALAMAHEIAHVAARHISSRLTWAAPARALRTLVRSAAGVVRVDAAVLEDRLPQLLLAPYARAQEREADRVALSMAASAGYAPTALAALLSSLRRRQDMTTGTAKAMFAYHPDPQERIDMVRVFAATVDRGPAAAAPDLLAAVDGLVVADSPIYGALNGKVLTYAMPPLRLVLPVDWVHEHGEQELVTVAPGGAAVLRLRVLTPREAEAEQQALRRESGFVDIHAWSGRASLSVLRGRLRYGAKRTATGYWYWLANDTAVLRLTLDSQLVDEASHVALVEAMLSRVQTLTAAELAGFQVTRLRVVGAQAGESLSQLAARTSATGPLDRLAALNALTTDEVLPAGKRVKIEKREPWFTTRAPRPVGDGENTKRDGR